MSRRRPIVGIGFVLVAAVVTACGSTRITLDRADRRNADLNRGAALFAQRCGGCHTLDAAGTEGSSVSIADPERVDGPNFNVRKENMADVLYAIRNGGFSGGIMPQNLVVGKDARDVAAFVAKYAGRKATAPKTPGEGTQPAGGRQPEVSEPRIQPEAEPPGTRP
jgi:mono/diheme cytochrome c family protein